MSQDRTNNSYCKIWVRCDSCGGYGGFDATENSNGGLCGKCKGHGGEYVLQLGDKV